MIHDRIAIIRVQYSNHDTQQRRANVGAWTSITVYSSLHHVPLVVTNKRQHCPRHPQNTCHEKCVAHPPIGQAIFTSQNFPYICPNSHVSGANIYHTPILTLEPRMKQNSRQAMSITSTLCSSRNQFLHLPHRSMIISLFYTRTCTPPLGKCRH